MMRTVALVVLLATFCVEGFARAATLTANSPPGSETLTPQNLKTSTNPGWASKCMSDTRKGPLVCSVEETLVLANTGQTVAAVSVRIEPGTHETMLIRVPVGLYLPAGLSFQIDDGKPHIAALQTCDVQGCLAEAEIGPPLVNELMGGRQLSIICENAAKSKIVLPLPLDSFAEAFQKIQ